MILDTRKNLSPADHADRRLSDLSSGERFEVAGIDASVTGAARQRLLDLGLTPGATVHRELTAPFRGAHAYRIRGALVALRYQLADRIIVRPAPATADATLPAHAVPTAG